MALCTVESRVMSAQAIWLAYSIRTFRQLGYTGLQVLEMLG